MSERASMPEQHACSYAARHHLVPTMEEGRWVWRIRTRRAYPETSYLITYCPWCGERLPEHGRLRVKEDFHMVMRLKLAEENDDE